MAQAKRSAGLQTIFSFFLGLMLTAFVGVGTYTFHPPPQRELNQQIEALDRREQAIRNSRPSEELTAAERDQIQEINDERNSLADAVRTAREEWGRSTSIILIIFATLAMAISLVRADQVPVISNGLLLGGVFTMVYGVGWIVAEEASVSRFVVMTVALAVTLALGYIRFVHRRAISAGPSAVGSANVEGVTDIELRVRALEERMDKAANALGPKSGH